MTERLEVLNLAGNRLTDGCSSYLFTILQKCKGSKSRHPVISVCVLGCGNSRPFVVVYNSRSLFALSEFLPYLVFLSVHFTFVLNNACYVVIL
jgi:hypothetical protein